MEPRHIDQRDEEVAETPWGPDVPAKPIDTPEWRAALDRYYKARAARRSEDSDSIDPISGIGGIDKPRS